MEMLIRYLLAYVSYPGYVVPCNILVVSIQSVKLTIPVVVVAVVVILALGPFYMK